MKQTQRENMLLFSKEISAGVNRYRLYFTPISSLKDETPRVFRLTVRLPFAFSRFEVGRLYTLNYSGVRIRSFEAKETFNLQEEDFSRLLQARDLKFMDKKTSAALRSADTPHFEKDRYYSFTETKQIVNYRPDFLTRVAISTFVTVVSGVAFFVPFGLYALMLYLLIRGQLALEGFSSKTLVLPIMGIGALPVLMLAMSVLFGFAELTLLRIDFTKWTVLRRYTLAWGGIRKSFFFEVSDMQYYKKFAIFAAAALALAVLLSLVV